MSHRATRSRRRAFETEPGSQLMLGDLLRTTQVIRTEGPADSSVRGIAYHSGAVREGFVFVAIPGTHRDGRDFVPEALEKGAVAVVLERPAEGLPQGVAQILVPSARRALADMASAWYGYPARRMTLVGVTGTNGKTTTTHMLEAILAAAGHRAGLLGTIRYRYGGRSMPAPNTTPESLDLQRMLREMLDNGVTHCIMEVTSHALDQERVRGCRFRVAAFTNLTRDHLDYHGDTPSYLAAKLRLFQEHLVPEEEGGVAVLNAEDPASLEIQRRTKGRIVWYGQAPGSDFSLAECSAALDGTRMRIRYPEGEKELFTPLLGMVNASNALAACASAWALGIGPEQWAAGLGSMPVVPGRLEIVSTRRGRPDPGVTVLVDYAHTPDALDRALSSVRGLARGRLICVFGCGGDRDRGKRPLMGKAAARHSDLLVVTSDNPRGEEPSRIIEQIVRGLEEVPLRPLGSDREETADALPAYVVIQDRAEAIRWAVFRARPGDLVFIAGKGHEAYQIIGDKKVPFNDRDVARKALEEAWP
jgi:UDP-N-acetylmuramoyl-L-alanyl-D-glutamate--2,6-diaminopimelate ligase